MQKSKPTLLKTLRMRHVSRLEKYASKLEFRKSNDLNERIESLRQRLVRNDEQFTTVQRQLITAENHIKHTLSKRLTGEIPKDLPYDAFVYYTAAILEMRSFEAPLNDEMIDAISDKVKSGNFTGLSVSPECEEVQRIANNVLVTHQNRLRVELAELEAMRHRASGH